MSGRDRRDAPAQGASFKLGDALGQDQKERLGVRSPDPIPAGKGHDPRVIASQLLNGELKVGGIPAGMVVLVLDAAALIHRAVVARSEETVRSLRSAIEASNAVSRGRDEAQVRWSDEVERHRRTAQEQGRVNLALRAELDRARAAEQESAQQLSFAREQIEELERQAHELRSAQAGIVEGKLQRRFTELVSTDLPSWLASRDQILARARHFTNELTAKIEQLEGALSELRWAIHKAEDSRIDRVFAKDSRAWEDYLACCEAVRGHQREHDSLAQEAERLFRRRQECATSYETLRSQGEQLAYNIRAVAMSFRQIDVDAWERVGVSENVLQRFDPPAEVIVLMLRSIPLPTLEAEYKARRDALFSHVLEPRGEPARAAVANEKPPAEVHFLSGSIFMVEPERELERLVYLILCGAHEAGVRQYLLVEEIATLLLRARLTGLAKRELMRLVSDACLALLSRNLVSRSRRSVEGFKDGLPTFRVNESQGLSEAGLLLSQVNGGHADQLKARIARVFPKTHHEG